MKARVAARAVSLAELPKRWYRLRPVKVQLAYYESRYRFNVVPAGRRSGKTERAKRKLVRKALSREGITHDEPARFFAGAPTRDQAKRIFWDDLKALTKPWWSEPPRESDLIIYLLNGSEIHVVGLDKPERIEGSPWDGGVLDEYGNMKAKAWSENVYPALADRNGWCDLVGVPEGRNHYYDVAQEAIASQAAGSMEWGYFHWTSAEVLPPEAIESARRNLDPLTFDQEYGGSFVTFAGRAYYTFTDANKASVRKLYDPKQPLLICLDFNVAPGVAAIAQEMKFPNGETGTGVIGEVWIPTNSNTPAVCRKLLMDWANHTGRIEVYGDATGGSDGSAKVQGSDWELVRQGLSKGYDGIPGWGTRVHVFTKPGNPSERSRVNAMNSRICTASGLRRMLVDPSGAPHVVKDLEGVRTLEGGAGEIDKKKDPKLTHISDALGYYVDYRFPVVERPEWGTSTFKR